MSFVRKSPVKGFSFTLVDKINGNSITSGTVSGFYLHDGGTQVALSNSPVHEGRGQWSIDITEDEMDADLVGLLFEHSLAISVSFTINTIRQVEAIIGTTPLTIPTNNINKVRLNISDTDKAIFTDTDIQVFLTDNDEDINLASADALEVMASGASLEAYMTKTNTKQVDFRQIANNLRRQADIFRSRSEDIPVIEVAEVNASPEAALQIVTNRAKRNL